MCQRHIYSLAPHPGLNEEVALPDPAALRWQNSEISENSAQEVENDLLPVVPIENGRMYFDSYTRCILDSLYWRNYDSSVVTWRNHLELAHTYYKCNKCSRYFVSLQVFNEHSLIFHLHDCPWPRWINLYRPAYNVWGRAEFRCILCGCFVYNGLRHFEEEHLYTSVN